MAGSGDDVTGVTVARSTLPEFGLPLEFVYAAALALLITQLREQAPMSDVLQSVRRLTTLARVGRVTIDAGQLASPPTDTMAGAVGPLRSAMLDHGLGAIDIATTVTDTEFLRVAGLLATPSAPETGGIVAAADAQGIWNVRLRGREAALPAPADVRFDPPSLPAARAASLDVDATSAPPSVGTSSAMALAEHVAAVRLAVQRADGAAVCRALAVIVDAEQFERAATPVALQLLSEWIMEDQAAFAHVHPLLERAGVRGARAVFEELVAATDTRERRMLYDTAASLSSTVEVARQYLGDPVWYVVRNAAGLLGESRNPDAIPDLARLLRHADERVRVAAVVALGQIGGSSAIGRLESVLFDTSSAVRDRALALVFASPEADALPTSVADVDGHESPREIGMETIAALAHVRTPRARRRLEALCLDTGRGREHEPLRLAAMNALADGHRPEAEATLQRLLGDPASSISERAALLLA